MKRGMGGGALRGPVAPIRQRKTIRFVQILLLLTAVAVFVFAGFVLARRGTDNPSSTDLGDPRRPSLMQPIALALLGAAALGTARALSDGPSVRVPTPARLDELAGRAEQVAIERAAD